MRYVLHDCTVCLHKYVVIVLQTAVIIYMYCITNVLILCRVKMAFFNSLSLSCFWKWLSVHMFWS